MKNCPSDGCIGLVFGQRLLIALTCLDVNVGSEVSFVRPPRRRQVKFRHATAGTVGHGRRTPATDAKSRWGSPQT
jgi:hypothetical protein